MTQQERVVFIAGDSTAAAKSPEKRPESGWGEHLAQHLRPGIRVLNYAVNGRSTKSFLAEGRLAEIERQLKPGDYLFIQFGHNDQKQEDPERYTDPEKLYQENLALFVKTARGRGAHPLIFSSVSRRAFVKGQIVSDNLGDYPQAARMVAERLQVPFVDLFQSTSALLDELGEEASRGLFLQLKPGESENYPDGVEDNTHFNEYGALCVARLAAAELRKLSLPIVKE